MAIWHGRVFVLLGENLLFMDAQPLAYNQWHHISYTWDGHTQKIYLNGVLVGSGQAEGIIKNNSNLNFGSLLKDYLLFEGQIDELRLWGCGKDGKRNKGKYAPDKWDIKPQWLKIFSF